MSLPQSLGPYPSGTTQTYTPAFNQTQDSISLGRLNDMVMSRLFDAKQATVVVTNGTNAIISGTTLSLSETVGGQYTSIAYDLGLGMAPGSPSPWDYAVINLTRGILTNLVLNVFFKTPPTSGSVSVQVAFQGGGGAVMGATGPLTTIHNAIATNATGGYLAVTGMGTALFAVRDITNATVNFVAYLEKGRPFPLQVTPWNGTTPVTSTTTPGLFVANVAGLNWVSANITNYVSGTVTVVAQASMNPDTASSGGGSGANPAQDGTDATGVAPPAGATGIRGWLSSIYNLFFGGTATVKMAAQGTHNTIAPTSVVQIGGRNGASLYAASVDNANNLTVGVSDSSGIEATIVPSGSDGDNINFTKLAVRADMAGFNGLNWSKVRVAAALGSPFYVALVNGAAASAVFTPSAGKKFRMMAAVVSVSIATRVQLTDGGTVIVDHDFAAGTTVLKYPGNGRLSAAANNVFGALIPAGAANASVGVELYGTQE